MTTYSLKIGKIRTTRPVYPSESGYVQSVNAQLNDLKAAINSLIQQLEGISPQICLDAVQPTFQKSLDYCPVDTGNMKSTGYAEIVSMAGGGRVEVGYGRGGNPPYTVFVHENLSNYHKPPTRAKWLQAAMMEDLMAIYARVQASYQAAMGG